MKLIIEESFVSSQSYSPRDPLVIDGKRVQLGFACIPLYTVRDEDKNDQEVKQFLSVTEARQFIALQQAAMLEEILSLPTKQGSKEVDLSFYQPTKG